METSFILITVAIHHVYPPLLWVWLGTPLFHWFISVSCICYNKFTVYIYIGVTYRMINIFYKLDYNDYMETDVYNWSIV